MNEQKNTDLIRKAYQQMSSGEIQSFLNLFADDTEWELPEMENVPFAGKWKGREGVGQFFKTVLGVQDIVEFEPEEYFAEGDKVVVLGHFLMRIKSAGNEFGSKWAHVWTVENDKITYFYEYVDTAVVSKAHTAARTAATRM
ncbi:nuclear transport factor 2 family protein [bacterium]|nr:nuclear transport factor 2 family protein [bacterium]